MHTCIQNLDAIVIVYVPQLFTHKSDIKQLNLVAIPVFCFQYRSNPSGFHRMVRMELLPSGTIEKSANINVMRLTRVARAQRLRLSTCAFMSVVKSPD